MKFKFIVCPECGKEKITEVNVCGTPCSCGKQLNNDTEENKKDIKNEWKESADAFSRTFEEFKDRMEREETLWNESNVFVSFKTVDIPDEILINYLRNKGE